MRREHSISSIVYHNIFPNPTPADPPDFATYLAKHLVSEVRIETQRFYGGLETVEARYPGLNYSNGPHRKRLARFAHHARLFRAFDELGLTEHEIGLLCRWEGTLWARQRYERDEGIKVTDTTGCEIVAMDRRPLKRKADRRAPREVIKVKTDIEVEIEEVRDSSATPVERGMAAAAAAAMMPAASSPWTVAQSMAANHPAVDPAWEAILKEAAESGVGAPVLPGHLSAAARLAAMARYQELRSASSSQSPSPAPVTADMPDPMQTATSVSQ